MNGRAIPGAYLFCLYVCDKEMSWPHHIGETHQPDWVVYVRDSGKFRLTNVIPERIIFVSRGITVLDNSSCVIDSITLPTISKVIFHPKGIHSLHRGSLPPPQIIRKTSRFSKSKHMFVGKAFRSVRIAAKSFFVSLRLSAAYITTDLQW